MDALLLKQQTTRGITSTTKGRFSKKSTDKKSKRLDFTLNEDSTKQKKERVVDFSPQPFIYRVYTIKMQKAGVSLPRFLALVFFFGLRSVWLC
jgi:hypothetical protein